MIAPFIRSKAEVVSRSSNSWLSRLVSNKAWRGFDDRKDRRAALRAHDHAQPMLDELPADQALEARSAQQREHLLVEIAGERRDRRHSVRNTPVTLPITWTCAA